MEIDNQWESKLNKYEKYKNYIRFLNACSGVWPDDKNSPRAVKIFLRFFSGFASALAICSMVLFDIKVAGSIEAFTRGFGMLVGFLAAFIKVCISTRYQSNLRFLNSHIGSAFERDMKDPRLRKHALKHFYNFSNLCYVYTILMGATTLLIALIPLLLAAKGKYVRSYPQYFPFNITPGGALHWIIYGEELYIGFYLWSVNSGFDSLFGLYLLYIAGELSVLSQHFRVLKSSENYKKDLKECIRRHRVILDSLSRLELIFGFIAIYLAVTCAVSTCSIIFQVSKMQNVSSISVCFYITALIVKILQAYIWGYYGSVLSSESEECLQAAYESHWPGTGDKQFMTDVIVILSQKPLVFKAMHSMYLNLDTCTKVLHASISYFFILRTLDTKA